MSVKVEKYEIREPGYKIVIEGHVFRVSQDDAKELYNQLANSLNIPAFEYGSCGDRMSHGPHIWGKNPIKYCSGRRFDAT